MRKYNELSEEDILYITEVYYSDKKWSDRLDLISEKFGIKSKSAEAWFRKLNLRKKTSVKCKHYEDAKKRKANTKSNKFIISWGQSETVPHYKFLDNIKAYSNEIGAEIHIVAGRYENPTSLKKNIKLRAEETWDDALLPYLDANRHDIHKKLSILSDIKIQPTAINPLSSLADISGANSCIFGSPRVHMESLPRLEGDDEKVMYTTGAVTVANYTDTKAGKKGDFHHTFGFIIVEIEDEETYHVRQVTAEKNGNFCDLFYRVKDGNVYKNDSISTIVLGDLHCGQHDEEILDGTLSLLNRLTPTNVVLHDVFNGESISHHDSKDPFIQYHNEFHGKNDLQNEIDTMLDTLSNFNIFKNVIITRGNHDDFVDRWLKNSDWKKQSTAKNYRLYMQLSDILLSEYEKSESSNRLGVIPKIINCRFPKFKCLTENQSFKVHGWELGYHGHLGVSGSRGSLMQYRKLNTKVVVGHYHSPERKDGALSVGTTTKLRLGYNKGASKWLHSHVIIHDNGKAQHIFLKRNKNNEVTFCP